MRVEAGAGAFGGVRRRQSGACCSKAGVGLGDVVGSTGAGRAGLCSEALGEACGAAEDAEDDEDPEDEDEETESTAFSVAGNIGAATGGQLARAAEAADAPEEAAARASVLCRIARRRSHASIPGSAAFLAAALAALAAAGLTAAALALATPSRKTVLHFATSR